MSCQEVAKRFDLFDIDVYIVSKYMWICFDDINGNMILLWWWRCHEMACWYMYIYIWFDTMIHLVVWWWLTVATRPLWSNLDKGRIMEILWSSDRGCYGWCLARQRGRVYHGVATWLTQPNTSVGLSTWCFLVLWDLKIDM